MIVAIDIGNTSLTFGVFDGAELKESFVFPTADFLEGKDLDHLKAVLIDTGATTIAYASVVTEITEPLTAYIGSLFPSATLLALRNSDIPIKNLYDQPDDVGIDRLLAATAAYTYYSKEANRPAISIDFGTATTFDCINSDGEYLGGAITLGIEATAKSLSAMTSKLPLVPLQFPPSPLGTNTIHGIQSGILYGAVTSVEGMVARLSVDAFNGRHPIVIATGGLSILLRDQTKSIDYIDPHLVLKGIVITALSL